MIEHLLQEIWRYLEKFVKKNWNIFQFLQYKNMKSTDSFSLKFQKCGYLWYNERKRKDEHTETFTCCFLLFKWRYLLVGQPEARRCRNNPDLPCGLQEAHHLRHYYWLTQRLKACSKSKSSLKWNIVITIYYVRCPLWVYLQNKLIGR